jgi:streptogramin lyase
LEFIPPFVNGQQASLVIGQSDFKSGAAQPVSATSLRFPSALTFDSQGNLWVADLGENRLLEFIPSFTGGQQTFVNGQQASLVIGQSNLTSAVLGDISASTLHFPASLTFDLNGALWVADRDNNRVLRFGPPIFGIGIMPKIASLVIGQSDFKSGAAQPVSATSLHFSSDHPLASIAFDSKGDLWTADTGNNRILMYR